jgi:hypothetical protein
MGADFHEGWVCLHRKIIDSMVFQNEGLLKVWIWCLAKANHEIKWVPIMTGRGSSIVKVEPGQFIFGRKTAAKELKMKESSVHYRMKILQKHQNLDMQPNSHYSIITIINWKAYQESKIESNRQPNKQLTGNQQATSTNNNDNNYNNKNISPPSGGSSPSVGDAHASGEKFEIENRGSETADAAILPRDAVILAKQCHVLDENKKPKPCRHQAVIDVYHSCCPSLPRVESWNEASQRVLSARWREKRERQEIEWWERYFRRVNLSDFLTGRVKDFVATLNWLIGPKNMEKVLNGAYDNRSSPVPERLRNNIRAGEEFINT